jgi:ferric-dicitrate binding protein FerR (iron transport regulator)
MVTGRTAAVTARADRVHGRVEVESPVAGGPDLAPARVLAAGDVVAVGSRLTTSGTAEKGAGGVALRMPGGASLRLAEATRMRLLSGEQIELERGAVYVDHASGEGDRARIEVVTPFGSVEEIGTQFSVRRSEAESQLEVRVREGEVRVVRPGATASARAGIELLVAKDGSIRRREIAAHGPEWDWVLDRAPGFDIEGRTLGEFLRWIERGPAGT